MNHILVNRLGVIGAQNIVKAPHTQRLENPPQHDVIEQLMLLRRQAAKVRQDSASQHMASGTESSV